MAFYYFSNLCCQVSLVKWKRDKADILLYGVLSLSPQVGLWLLLPLKIYNLDQAGPLGCWQNLPQTHKLGAHGKNTKSGVPRWEMGDGSSSCHAASSFCRILSNPFYFPMPAFSPTWTEEIKLDKCFSDRTLCNPQGSLQKCFQASPHRKMESAKQWGLRLLEAGLLLLFVWYIPITGKI